MKPQVLSDRLQRRALAILVAMSAGTLAGCDLITADYSARATNEWTRAYSLGTSPTVEITNVNGQIRVEPAGDETVTVRAERTARAATEEAAKALAAQIEIQESTTRDAVTITTRLPRAGSLFGGSSEVRYTVRVPADGSVRLRTVNGAVRVEGIRGAVTARTTNGSVTGRALGGTVEASTTNGAIDMEVDAISDEGIQLETTNGSIDLAVPPSAAATISARLSNGRIDASSLPLEVQGEVSRRRLDGRLNGGGPPVRLETTNGSIRVSGKP